MTGSVARRWHDLEPRCHADASSDRHVRELGDIPVDAGEVRFSLREREMVSLDDEGRLWKRTVVARVVEMQMAIHDDGHIVRANAERGQARNDRIVFRQHNLEAASAE